MPWHYLFYLNLLPFEVFWLACCPKIWSLGIPLLGVADMTGPPVGVHQGQLLLHATWWHQQEKAWPIGWCSEWVIEPTTTTTTVLHLYYLCTSSLLLLLLLHYCCCCYYTARQQWRQLQPQLWLAATTMNSLENLQPSRRIIQPQGETEQCTNVVETVLLLVWHPFSTEPIFTLRLEAVFWISLKN